MPSNSQGNVQDRAMTTSGLDPIWPQSQGVDYHERTKLWSMNLEQPSTQRPLERDSAA